MSKISIESIVVRNSHDVAETELDGNVVILHIESGKYYNFNQSSSDLWNWLNEPIPVSGLVRKLCDKYDCSEEIAIKDTLNFLKTLYLGKLLEIN